MIANHLRTYSGVWKSPAEWTRTRLGLRRRSSTIALSQKFIGSVLDPVGHVDIGRSSMSGVVFEPAILRRVV